MTSITAIITTRNRPAALVRAIDSVKSQTRPVAEIVIVDEGSEPPVEPNDPLLTIVRNNEPTGPAAARNSGADVAGSEYVAFLDDDDWWLPEKIEKISRCLAGARPPEVVFHTVSRELCQNERAGACHRLDDPIARMLQANPPHASGLTVHRDLHAAVRFDESYPGAEDLDYNVRLALQATGIVEIQRVLAAFGASDEQPSAISLEARIDGRLKFRDQHSDLFMSKSARLHHEMQLGHLYRRAGRRADSRRAFSRALRLDPISQHPWKGMARLYLPQRRRY